MRFEPGPLPQQSESLPPDATEAPGFGDLTRSEMLSPSLFEGDIDSALDAMTVYTAPNPGDAVIGFINDATAAAADYAVLDTDAPLAVVNQDIYTGDGYLLQSYGATPAEAWQQVPPALQEPGTPQIAAQPGTSTITIGLPGQPTNQNFTVGGPYQVTALVTQIPGGAAEVADLGIEMVVYLRYGDPQDRLLGKTDATGRFVFNGTWGAADAGEWYIGFIVIGHSISINAGNGHFTVGPATPGGGTTTPTTPITSTIYNLNTGSSTVFHVGNQWILNITGAPGQAVRMQLYKNGGLTFDGLIGSTDSTGRLQGSGIFQAIDMGHWTELYWVGNVQWSGSNTFDVVA